MQAHVLLLTGLGLLALGGCGDSDSGPDGGDPAEEPPPNILFIVVDDAGVDQFEAFGYGGATPANTHNINAIAEAGVRFRNTWSMPTCSPTRATFFNGRYPFRSGVRNAIVSTDLANSQPSPYALTIPKLLREEKGYVSALVGKMHLSGSDLNPANHPMHDNAMRELGWDYFAGYLDGAPYPIDTTAGGVAPEGTYQCGFVPTTAADGDHGADFGVCYLPDNDPSGQPWTVMQNSATPGRTCLERGGILDPGTLTASEERRAQLDFDIQNGYYTGEWKINYENGDNETLFADNPRARGYRLILEAQYAIAWIVDKQSLESDTPWMMTVGFSALHAPLQPPPTALLPHPDATLSLLGCGTPVADALAELGLPATGDIADFAQQRVVAQHMLEAVDHEIGRLLEDTHIADRQDDGSLRYNPDSNTVVVLVGDNGTYMPSVKLPFDPLRAKGSLYQTGVWVPLLIAGPASIVHSPDRDVEHQVNTTDLFSLFREIAGIDDSALPAWLTLDAQPLRPYLEEPGRTGIRDYNFSEQGTNIAATPPPPCVIPAANTCVQIFPQEAVCADQGGVWYGPDENGNGGFDSCCAVNDQLISQNDEPVEIFPQDQRTLRNEHYKLVRISRQDCELDTLVDSEEFYRIDQAIPTPELDRADANLIANGEGNLSDEQAASLTTLRDQLDQLLATATDCTGDGNDDLLVDQTDLDEWAYWADTDAGRGLSSWYDLNHDGLTDAADRAIIESNMGAECRSTQNR